MSVYDLEAISCCWPCVRVFVSFSRFHRFNYFCGDSQWISHGKFAWLLFDKRALTHHQIYWLLSYSVRYWLSFGVHSKYLRKKRSYINVIWTYILLLLSIWHFIRFLVSLLYGIQANYVSKIVPSCSNADEKH